MERGGGNTTVEFYTTTAVTEKLNFYVLSDTSDAKVGHSITRHTDSQGTLINQLFTSIPFLLQSFFISSDSPITTTTTCGGGG